MFCGQPQFLRLPAEALRVGGDEPRRGAIALVGAVDTVGDELDLAAAEAEDRRVRELANGIGSVFVTGAVDVQLLALNEPLGMRQDHAPCDEGPQAELVGSVDHAHPSHGPTAMGQAKLRWNE